MRRRAPGSGERGRELCLAQVLATPVQELVQAAGPEHHVPVLAVLGQEAQGVRDARHHTRHRSHPEVRVNIGQLYSCLICVAMTTIKQKNSKRKNTHEIIEV